MDTQRITDNYEFGSEQKPTEQLMMGTTLINRYLIQGVIGVGGMGAVYNARDLHFPNVVKRVAVKEMVNLARDPEVRKIIIRNFEREANILATLDHPSIPRIYDYFSHEERSYLILEFIDGKDLEAILEEGQGFLPEAQVVTWAIELCEVISYLHNHLPEPIVFRDMKPSNIMINNRGHVVLVDFGIAKTFQSGERGTMIGTEGYSPPEQYKGQAGPQADLYALGATLHHLLTRRDPRLEPPFSFGERSIRSINPSVSPELEIVIYTALKYNPEERFRNAQAMKEALLGSAKKTGILSKLNSPITQVDTGMGSAQPLWKFECEDEIRGTPACQEGVLYVGAYDNNLYALNASSGEFIWKFPAEAGIVSRPAVFEGNVYFGSEDGRLYVISARSGKVVWTYHTHGPIRSSPYIAEGHVFIGSDDGFIHAVSALSGRLAWRMEAGTPIRSTPLIYGDNVYFGSEGGDFFCLDLRAEIKWRFKAKRAITSSPIVFNNVIFIGSVDGYLYALEAKSGFLLWRFRLGKATISTPCVAENYLFIGSVDNHLYCLDVHSAKELWRFPTDHQVTGSPIIDKDSLYCGSVDGHLYHMEYRTGRMRWKFPTGGPITGSPVANNDMLFFGSADHFIYALAI
jgi:outer membrane protein assembly factor BamB/tRNA A-37 threonylcarbamoyl transferase component Bud32